MSIATNPSRAAFAGLLLILPFVVLNFIVAGRVEPTDSFPGRHLQTPFFEPLIPTLLLLLFPVAAFVIIRPSLRPGADGTRRGHLLNIAFAALVFTVFVVLALGLGEEIYRSDILRIPNCD